MAPARWDRYGSSRAMAPDRRSAEYPPRAGSASGTPSDPMPPWNPSRVPERARYEPVLKNGLRDGEVRNVGRTPHVGARFVQRGPGLSRSDQALDVIDITLHHHGPRWSATT